MKTSRLEKSTNAYTESSVNIVTSQKNIESISNYTLQRIIENQSALEEFTRPKRKPKFKTFPQDQVMPLVTPSIFYQNNKMELDHVANGQLIKNTLLEDIGDNLLALLMQGSLMRGDGEINSSDLDYIVILKKLDPTALCTMTELKIKNNQNNFLYLTQDEYHQYPADQRLQFFLTRQIYSQIDLGAFPYPSEVQANLKTNAIQLKDKLRPLLFELADSNHLVLSQVHTLLKRVDDLVLRPKCFLETGYFPLNRQQYQKLTSSQNYLELAEVLNSWYTNQPSESRLYKLLVKIDTILNQIIQN